MGAVGGYVRLNWWEVKIPAPHFGSINGRGGVAGIFMQYDGDGETA